MRSLALGLGVLVLLACAAGSVAPGTAAAAPRAAPAGHADGAWTQATADDRPKTVMRVALTESGSARWDVVTRYPITSQNEAEALRRLVNRLQNGSANGNPETFDVGPEAFRGFAAMTSNETGRPMRIKNVSYAGSVNDGMGKVTLSFRWTNFANTTGDGYRVGDVFSRPSGGTWLSLGPNHRLVITPPEGYNLERVRGFEFDRSESIAFANGPRQFPAQPLLVYEQTDDSPARSPAVGNVDGFVLDGVSVLLGAMMIAVIAAGAAYVRWGDGDLGFGVGGLGRDAGRAEGWRDPGPDTGGETDGGTAADDATDGTADAERTPAGPATDETGAADGDAADETADGDAPDAVDPSLLSDGERVEHLIQRNGGRMRQGDIVSETGWSDAKVSQLLSRLDDEGRIEKLRLGRENLISLAEDNEE